MSCLVLLCGLFVCLQFFVIISEDLMVTIGSLDLLRRKLSGLNRNLLELQFFLSYQIESKTVPLSYYHVLVD